MGKSLLIFVAGPLSSTSTRKRMANVKAVHQIVKQLMLKGHYVIECHSLEFLLYDDKHVHHTDFLNQTIHWLERCDAVYFIGHSPGANIELDYAKRLRLRIFKKIDDVPNGSSFQQSLENIDKMLKQQRIDGI